MASVISEKKIKNMSVYAMALFENTSCFLEQMYANREYKEDYMWYFVRFGTTCTILKM